MEQKVRPSHRIEISDLSSSVSLIEDVEYPESYNIENVLRLVKRALLALGYHPDLVEERIKIIE